MKKNKRQEILTKDVKELIKMLKDLRNELFNLRLDQSQNKLKNNKAIFFKRKEIALVLTALNKAKTKGAENENV